MQLVSRARRARTAAGLGLVVLALLLVGSTIAGAQGTTTTVTPANLGLDWFWTAPQAETRAGGFVEIVNGPTLPNVLPPFGSGSVRMTTDCLNPTGCSFAKAQLFTYQFMGKRLSEITAIAYDAYRDGASTNSSFQTFGLNITIDINGGSLNAGEYANLVFEPTYNGQITPPENVWQHYDASSAKWWTTATNVAGLAQNTYQTSWQQIATSNPNATIIAIGFNLGSGWSGKFIGAGDGVVVGVNGVSTTFDFELDCPTCAKNTTVVTEVNPSGWGFGDDRSNGLLPLNYVDGPGTTPMGTGSAAFSTAASLGQLPAGSELTGDQQILYKLGYAGTKLSQFFKLTYSSYTETPSDTTILAPSLALVVDYDLSDTNTGWQGRLVYEPYMGGNTVVPGTWQTWDAMKGKWWMSGNARVTNSSTGVVTTSKLCPQNAPCTWPEVILKYPNAGIGTTGGDAIIFKAGSSNAWPAFVAYVDGFTIGISGIETTYDFDHVEPDTEPPVVTVVGTTPLEATSANGAVVTFTASATDNVDVELTLSCDATSGETFPLGLTTVTCTATDSSGNPGSGSFTVTVVDTTPPTLSVPDPITKNATSAAGAEVTFAATATDLVDPAPTVSCSPASGSTFPIGTTTVGCTASDAAGTKATSSFTVTVNRPVATNANQCKNGGWTLFARTNGTPFKNQGDCVSYVNTGK